MKKYITKLYTINASLAVERWLGEYMRENYLNALVSEAGIHLIVEDLRREMDDYLRREHTAKPVEIHVSRPPYGEVSIMAGALTITLWPVLKEIGFIREEERHGSEV